VSRGPLSSVVLAGLVSILSSPRDQAPTFTSRVEAVRVDVLVSQDGRPLTGLTAADFEVLDNGVRQQIDHAAFEEIPLNVVFAIDASGSVEGERARQLRAACRGVLGELKKDDQAGLVVFSDPVVVRAGLTHDIAAVSAAVARPLPVGETSLVDAAQTSILLAESQPGRALVIVFSDAIEVSSYLPYNAVVDTAKRSDAVVYGVSVRGVAKPRFVPDLAEASGGDVFEIATAADIESTFRKVLDEFRHRYLLSYTLTGVERAGWHRLQVRVRLRGASVKARPGYFRQ
jgi:Ca-activated chloride channel homolog